ncbi:MAG: hypothetical protein ACRDQY_17485 [Pseudonocardiaceae bacterium]
MLEALEVTDGCRVLEIGTGSGDNAALLCERLGSAYVTSVDIDPELVEINIALPGGAERHARRLASGVARSSWCWTPGRRRRWSR